MAMIIGVGSILATLGLLLYDTRQKKNQLQSKK